MLQGLKPTVDWSEPRLVRKERKNDRLSTAPIGDGWRLDDFFLSMWFASLLIIPLCMNSRTLNSCYKGRPRSMVVLKWTRGGILRWGGELTNIIVVMLIIALCWKFPGRQWKTAETALPSRAGHWHIGGNNIHYTGILFLTRTVFVFLRRVQQILFTSLSIFCASSKKTT
jgi:hypothetical protein